MAPVATKSWSGDYCYRAFQVCATDIEFPLSRRSVAVSDEHLKGSNISAIWTLDVQETLINGVLQGRKQIDPQGASTVSKRKMWELALRVLMHIEEVAPSEADRYVQTVLNDRRRMKYDVTLEALNGWIRNHDDGFKRPSLETANSSRPYSEELK